MCSCASQNDPAHVRFGSLADILEADILDCPSNVGFTPESGHQAVQLEMSRCGHCTAYSMTSSAIAISFGDRISPRALAALRLTTNSNLSDKYERKIAWLFTL
jgi:hypothetical protein